MAPQGKHYMSVFIQYVPYNLADGGWTEEKRLEFGKHVMSRIGNYSTNFNDIINHAEIRTPKELEAEVGLTEGNIFQGELTMDQLMFNVLYLVLLNTKHLLKIFICVDLALTQVEV